MRLYWHATDYAGCVGAGHVDAGLQVSDRLADTAIHARAHLRDHAPMYSGVGAIRLLARCALIASHEHDHAQRASPRCGLHLGFPRLQRTRQKKVK